MQVGSSSASLSSAGGIWAQVQQQQAQRTADQAEQRAQALQARAREAQTEADADRAGKKKGGKHATYFFIQATIAAAPKPITAKAMTAPITSFWFALASSPAPVTHW